MTSFLLKPVLMIALSLGLGACSLDRGEGENCAITQPAELDARPAIVSQARAPSASAPASPSDDDDEMVETMADAIRQTVRDQTPVGMAQAQLENTPVVVEVLSLSAGGQFGSYGAGFLRGWAENLRLPRPDFDLVTGVSAGGMLAPVAFSGRANDVAFDTYRGLATEDVIRRRPFFVLANTPSFFDASPLEQRLTALLSDRLIEDVAARHRAGAKLLILAVNLDDTKARVFDLGDMAAQDWPIERRRKCMREVMLASAAIPGIFPPRNIDGNLYVDGGLRDQIFLREVETARVQVARETGRPLQIKATIVVNGALTPPQSALQDSLFGYAERSLFTLSDEVLRDSILETLSFADANENWDVQGVLADVDLEDICPISEASGTFSPCVTTALYDAGRALGRKVPIEFISSEKLRILAEEF